MDGNTATIAAKENLNVYYYVDFRVLQLDFLRTESKLKCINTFLMTEYLFNSHESYQWFFNEGKTSSKEDVKTVGKKIRQAIASACFAGFSTRGDAVQYAAIKRHQMRTFLLINIQPSFGHLRHHFVQMLNESQAPLRSRRGHRATRKEQMTLKKTGLRTDDPQRPTMRPPSPERGVNPTR